MSEFFWSMPAEPGESVTSVRDYKTNRIWDRDGDRWRDRRTGHRFTWYRLLGYGPIYDVTEKNNE